VEFEILYGEGISHEGELIELGVAQNLIDKSGAWYSYQGSRIGQGKDNVRAYLKENKKIAVEIDKKLRDILLSGKVTPLSISSKSKEKMEDKELIEA